VVVVGRIKKGVYFDSVTLMTVGRDLAGLAGVIDAAVVMGTSENLAILRASGLMTEDLEGAGDTDLIIAVSAESEDSGTGALAQADELLRRARSRGEDVGEARPRSIQGALEAMPDANLAIVSVAGRYAGRQAMAALNGGLHVMIFSDNVPLETEIGLKAFARERDLLVMGPDCGTAIINGVPLGFANVVNRGSVGIVAASGTGLQEVACIISNEGGGISQAIGTGGRDVTKEVGGATFLRGIEALAADAETDVIVLVSKPPAAEVLTEITGAVEAMDKPVVSVFLGADSGSGATATTLDEAAFLAAALATGGSRDQAAAHLASQNDEMRTAATGVPRRESRRYIRALMSGGTFCAEAQVVLRDTLPDLHSNIPLRGVAKLDDALKSRMHTLIDLGDDAFTVGRPHPMIDYTLRKRRILEEASDPEVAVILLDVVLGYGAHLDPAGELCDVVGKACETVSVICSITGTDRDPQNRELVGKRLKDAGAIVAPTNAAACRLAGAVVQSSGGV
jgi:succinyl-CoA synthetase alpha subunit